MSDAKPWWRRIPWIHLIDALFVVVAVLTLLALTADYCPRLADWMRTMRPSP